MVDVHGVDCVEGRGKGERGKGEREEREEILFFFLDPSEFEQGMI